MNWKVLDLGLPRSPQVLLKARFDDSGYEIQLTDLSRVWSQVLSKDDIVKRAQDTGSSVDPGEDDAQFKIFLGKIESALNREENTSLTFTSSEGDDGAELSFELLAPLPRPLAPFTWTLHLKRQPQQRIASELVTPLALQANNLRDQIQQLVDELHDKDRIISKICDRLETSGNDLTTVFPGVSNIRTSRKKGQREQLERYVKGLEDFDETAWRRHNAEGKRSHELNAHLIGAAFRDLPTFSETSHGLAVHDWWRDLGAGSDVRQSSINRLTGSPDRNAAGTSGKANGVSQQSDGTMQDEEFQRQVTSPRLKGDHSEGINVPLTSQETSWVMEVDTNEERTSKPVNDDSTTDDGGDLDAPPIKFSRYGTDSRIAEKPEPSAPKRLGLIGARPSQALPSKSKSPTKDEAELPKPRPKLGMIGSKSKASDASASSLGPDEPVRQSSPVKVSQLGMIGSAKATALRSHSPPPAGKNQQPSEPMEEPVLRQSRAPTKENTPPPRGSSQERANKKRDQLKRDLEEKAKAPVKKKRKF